MHECPGAYAIRKAPGTWLQFHSHGGGADPSSTGGEFQKGPGVPLRKTMALDSRLRTLTHVPLTTSCHSWRDLFIERTSFSDRDHLRFAVVLYQHPFHLIGFDLEADFAVPYCSAGPFVLLDSRSAFSSGEQTSAR